MREAKKKRRPIILPCVARATLDGLFQTFPNFFGTSSSAAGSGIAAAVYSTAVQASALR
jgi:hypothetical protein